MRYHCHSSGDEAEAVESLQELTTTQLVEIILQQQQVLTTQQQRLAELERQVEQLQRAGQRQATPFARQQPQTDPKPAGRKPGQGVFTYRATPAAAAVTATQEAPLPRCPHCAGRLRDRKTHQHFETDIPPVQPVVVRYVTHSGYCDGCRQRVRSQHPTQLSQATGAAGVALGPRAIALAADLKHRLGVPYAKISELFEVGFGLRVSRSGLWQADQRLAAQARPVYAELLDCLHHCAQVHMDETGWRIGTLSAWLWVATNQQLTVYHIASGAGQARSHQVVLKLLGAQFRGVLISDCFTAYDHQEFAHWLKQKCLAHLLKDLSAMQETKSGRALHFARQVSGVLRAALALRDQRANLNPVEFAVQAQQLETQLDVLIAAHRRFADADNRRFAKRLRKQRPHLLRFLYVAGVDATNNAAERKLRPAVITRKTGGCNRSAQGAATHAVLSSVLVTCRQQQRPLLDFLVQVQQALDGALPSLAPSAIPCLNPAPP